MLFDFQLVGRGRGSIVPLHRVDSLCPGLYGCIVDSRQLITTELFILWDVDVTCFGFILCPFEAHGLYLVPLNTSLLSHVLYVLQQNEPNQVRHVRAT